MCTTPECAARRSCSAAESAVVPATVRTWTSHACSAVTPRGVRTIGSSRPTRACRDASEIVYTSYMLVTGISSRQTRWLSRPMSLVQSPRTIVPAMAACSDWSVLRTLGGAT